MLDTAGPFSPKSSRIASPSAKSPRAVPVACDVDPQSLCLDWRDAEQRITEKTKAIMPVHYSGGVGDLDSIYAVFDYYYDDVVNFNYTFSGAPYCEITQECFKIRASNAS